MTGRRGIAEHHSPGRGAWLRRITGWAARDCADLARFICARPAVFVDDVPAELRGQLDKLERARLVRIEPDGFIRRAHGNSFRALEGANHDHTEHR